MLKSRKIILASASPRRRELLGMLGVKDFIVSPAASEADYPKDMEPAAAVAHIALKKAESGRDSCGAAAEGHIILAADTVVCLEGAVLGKPADAEEAAGMLRALSGRKHTVYTGVALVCGETKLTDSAATEVWFRELAEAEIRADVASGEPMDKAGAYGAQGLAALFVERIEGEYYNVVGLPLCKLGAMFGRLGLPLL